MIKTLILLLVLVVGDNCFAQRTLLVLQKRNKNKNVYYKTGDEISFRLNESKERITGHIYDFQDSVVVFKGFKVKVSEISSLYIDEKTKWWLRYKIEQLGFITGGGYLLLTIINNDEISKDVLIISGTLIGVGLIAKVLIGNRIRIKGSTRLRIIRL